MDDEEGAAVRRRTEIFIAKFIISFQIYNKQLGTFSVIMGYFEVPKYQYKNSNNVPWCTLMLYWKLDITENFLCIETKEKNYTTGFYFFLLMFKKKPFFT